MPVITAMHVAIRESGRQFRAERAAAGHPSHAVERALPAGLEKALDDVEALALTLHREDGSLIPTESIGLQDTEELLVTARMTEEELGYDEQFDETELDPALREDIEHDLAILAEMEFEEDEPWRGEPEPTEWPRYQVLARVLNEMDVP